MTTKRILLVVDDHDDIRKVVSFVLKRDPIEIVEAKNGIQATSMARMANPSVILMDVQMPVMDGFQVFQLLKSDPACKDIKFIMMSANTAQGAMDMVKTAGAYATLQKPLKHDVLRKTVRAAFGLPADEEPPKGILDRLRGKG